MKFYHSKNDIPGLECAGCDHQLNSPDFVPVTIQPPLEASILWRRNEPYVRGRYDWTLTAAAVTVSSDNSFHIVEVKCKNELEYAPSPWSPSIRPWSKPYTNDPLRVSQIRAHPLTSPNSTPCPRAVKQPPKFRGWSGCESSSTLE